MAENIFLYLGVILFSTKVCSIIMRKLGLPQVVGALIAGVIIGLIGLVPGGFISLESPAFTVIKTMAEIGVVMLMFSAGLETNVKDIKQNGVGNIIITSLGVIVPLGAGFLLSWAFTGFEVLNSGNILSHLYIGILITATSVGITVATLKEMGKLKGKIGSSILSAAILDDIIGIVILTIAIGVKTGKSSVGTVFLELLMFFVVAVILGIAVHYAFKWLSKKYPVTRRLPIFGLAICFLFAWGSEKFFHVADITGAYLAGMIMSNMKETEYVGKKIDINSYMIFSPIFFASIGISIDYRALFSGGLNWGKVIAFSICFVIVGMLTKVIGCGFGAKISKFSTKDSLRVGLGMMARGEVCLIMVQKALDKDVNLLQPEIMISVVLLVIVSSLLTPIFLKIAFKPSKQEKLQASLLQGPLELAEIPEGQKEVRDIEATLDMTSQSLDLVLEMNKEATLEDIKPFKSISSEFSDYDEHDNFDDQDDN